MDLTQAEAVIDLIEAETAEAAANAAGQVEGALVRPAGAGLMTPSQTCAAIFTPFWTIPTRTLTSSA